MLAVWVRLRVRAGREAEFWRAIASNARDSLALEPGCLRFDVMRVDAPSGAAGAGGTGGAAETAVAFYEVYRDRTAYEVEHRSAAHYRAWRSAADRTIVPGSQSITTGELVGSVTEPSAFEQ